MKKIVSLLILSLLLSIVILTAFAAPSPTTSAGIGDLVIETEDETIEIPKEDSDEYVKIIHVHEAEEGSDLDKIGDSLSTDKKIADVIGEEYDGNKLIQLFEIVTSDKFDGTKVVINDRIIEIKDGKVIITIEGPSFTENMNVVVTLFQNGHWVHADHVRAFNGYITIELPVDQLNSIYAVMVEKAPVSPPTGEAGNQALFVALVAFSALGMAFATKKYLLNK